jgi:antitoxin component YwqK of YwqJK toxin-antitoxin module
MNKIFALFTFLLFSLLSKGQSNQNIELWYPSGKVQIKSFFDESCQCEKIISYYESGQVRYTRASKILKDNQRVRDGEDILYFENGEIRMYQLWTNGILTGSSYSKHENGKLAYEKTYSDGYKSGTWRFYNENEKLKEELVFVPKKTPWNSDNDFALRKHYLDHKLAYTVELNNGKPGKTTIIDQMSYDLLKKSELPLGETLFSEYCTGCHRTDIDLVGPMMKGVTQARTEDWLFKMISNGNSLVKNGDKDAVLLYKNWNSIEHPNFEKLSKEEVSSIIMYLKSIN